MLVACHCHKAACHYHEVLPTWSTCLQAFQERFGGWNSSQVVEPFRQYAKTVFKAFGNRVKHWTTMNEPQTFCFVGYSAGSQAPGIQDQVGNLCI